jgi:hypothetical protein
MPFARNSLGSGQPLLENELLGYGRDPIDPSQDVVTVDGTLVVPIDLQSWGVWLKATFGAATTTEDTGVYTHVFKSGGWVLPSLSIEKGMPEVPQFSMSRGCMVNRLNWTMQRSGHLQANVDLIGQGEVDATTSQAGTLSDWEITRFGQFNGSISRDGSALANVVNAEISYTNNLDAVETIRDDGLIDGIDPSIAGLSGRITLRFASTALLDQATNGTACALKFELTRSASQKFQLDVPRVFLPRPKINIEGPNGIQATFDWQAAQQTDGGAMCTATLINDVSTY